MNRLTATLATLALTSLAVPIWANEPCQEFDVQVSTWKDALSKGDSVALEMAPPCKAAAYYRQGLALLANTSPDDLAARSTLLDRLGVVLGGMGQTDEAELLLLRSLQLRLGQPGHEAELADTLDHLAGLHYHQGEPEEGLRVYQQALDYRERVFGSDSMEYAKSLTLVGTAYDMQGNVEKATELYQRAATIYRHHAKTPEDREQYGTLLISFGLLMEKQGDDKRGKQLKEEGRQVLDEVPSG